MSDTSSQVYTFKLTRRFVAIEAVRFYFYACAAESVRWYDPRAIWLLFGALWSACVRR